MKIYLSQRKFCKRCSDSFCVRYDCKSGAPEKCSRCDDKDRDKCQHIHSLKTGYTCQPRHSRDDDKCRECCQICLHTYIRPAEQRSLFHYEFRSAGINPHDEFEKCYNYAVCGNRFFLEHKTLKRNDSGIGHSLVSVEVATTWEKIHSTVNEKERWK